MDASEKCPNFFWSALPYYSHFSVVPKVVYFLEFLSEDICLLIFREIAREKHWLPPVCAPTGAQTRNLGICPDWESSHLARAPELSFLRFLLKTSQ